jgi:membrane fusion protein (multidrug efflux system)
MRKTLIVLGLLAAAAGAYLYINRSDGKAAGTASAGAGGGRAPGGGAFARPPMTVDLAAASRETVAEEITIVGNLIGRATVEIVPKVGGRLEEVRVQLGDPVREGQLIARLEDREVREQVRQAEAAFAVGQATIRQRDADLTFAETNVERSRSLFTRQLLPRQTLDDAEARYQSAVAQLDLARAQFDQARARLDELRITLGHMRIVSPVDGFVSRRDLDPGGFASSSAPVASVVDIRVVRLVANLVERDLRRVTPGTPARVDVDAFPGEVFEGRVARIAPVLDPATRTAQMEVEIPNPSFRLKPGMYARVALQLGRRERALVVPRNALVDVDGRRGVFLVEGGQAKFQLVEVGLQDERVVEIVGGLAEGQAVVTTGASALREGDPVVEPGQQPPAGSAGAGAGTGGQRQRAQAQPGR